MVAPATDAIEISELQAALRVNRALQRRVARELDLLAAERDALMSTHNALVTTVPSAASRGMLGVEAPPAERRNERKPFRVVSIPVASAPSPSPSASLAKVRGSAYASHRGPRDQQRAVWGSCLGYLEHAHRHSFLGRARSATQAVNVRDGNEGRDPTRADHVAIDGLCRRYEPFCLAYAVCPAPPSHIASCDDADETARTTQDSEDHHTKRRRVTEATGTRRVTEVMVCAAPLSPSEVALFEAQLQFPQHATEWTWALDAALVGLILQRCQSRATAPDGSVPLDGVRDFTCTDWIDIALTLRHQHVPHRKPYDAVAAANNLSNGQSHPTHAAADGLACYWGPKDCLRFDGNTTASISGSCCRHRWDAVFSPLLMLLPHGVAGDMVQQLLAAAASQGNRPTVWSHGEDAALQKLLAHPSVQFLVCRPVWAKLETLLSTEIAQQRRLSMGVGATAQEAEEPIDTKQGALFCNTDGATAQGKAEDGKWDDSAKPRLLAELVSQVTQRRSAFAIAARFQQQHNPYHLVSGKGVGLAATMRAAMVNATTKATGLRSARRRAALSHLAAAVQQQLPAVLPEHFSAAEDARLRWCANNCGRHGEVHPGDLWVAYTQRTLSLCALEESEAAANRRHWGAAPFYSATYFFRSKAQVAARWLAIAADPSARASVDRQTPTEPPTNVNVVADAAMWLAPVGICDPLEREEGGNGSSNATRQRGRVPLAGLVSVGPQGDAVVTPQPLPHPTSWHDTRLKFLAAFSTHVLFAVDAIERRTAASQTAAPSQDAPHAAAGTHRVVQRRDYQTVAVYVLDGIVSSRRLSEYLRFTRLDSLGVLQGPSTRQQRQTTKSTQRKPHSNAATRAPAMRGVASEHAAATPPRPRDHTSVQAVPPPPLASPPTQADAESPTPVPATARAKKAPRETLWNEALDGVLEQLVEKLRVPWQLERRTPDATPQLTPSVVDEKAPWAQVAYLMQVSAAVIAQQPARGAVGQQEGMAATTHHAAATFTPRNCHARFASIVTPRIFPPPQRNV